MPEQPSPDSPTTFDTELRNRSCGEKPEIRILLYTDDPNGITDTDDVFGLGPMIRHLKGHKPTFAKEVSVEWVSRYARNTLSLKNKLDDLLKDDTKRYDEVWFFPTHQAHNERFTSSFVRGGPNSELVDTELQVLREWMTVGKQSHMRGGGVLMTGDHNQELVGGTLPSPSRALCPDQATTERFLGLGRALGRCVPRAGRLRKWEGEPTNRPEDSLNTQVLVGSFDIENQGLQLDDVPQRICLLKFDEKGKPSRSGKPHPLFFYRDGQYIQFFPDHAHEGAIILPQESEFTNTGEWPNKQIQPRPHVLARGLDNRTCTLIDLVAAYDGDSVNVGRVAADSTWHHYISVNLSSFPHPSDVGTPADQIGQFYGNLAMWLTPRATRREMARVMFCQLANHPLMIEEVGSDPLSIGRTAYAALLQQASPCEIHELLNAAVPEQHQELYETIYFSETHGVLSPFPSKTLLLGSIIKTYHEEIIRTENRSERLNTPRADELIFAGFQEAMKAQANLLQPIISEAMNLAQL